MLRKLDKVAPYLVLALLGYLGYCANEVSTVKPAAAKEAPVITRNMLHPVLITPSSHASPVDRDPFDVEWSRYISPEDRPIVAAAGRPVSVTRPAAGASTTEPSATVVVPPLPRQLNGVMIGPDFRAVIVDDWVYKVGSCIPENNPGNAWRIESIEIDSIELSFGEIRQVLRMSEDLRAATRPASKEHKR